MILGERVAGKLKYHRLKPVVSGRAMGERVGVKLTYHAAKAGGVEK